jgi:hypothetical protein
VQLNGFLLYICNKLSGMTPIGSPYSYCSGWITACTQRIHSKFRSSKLGAFFLFLLMITLTTSMAQPITSGDSQTEDLKHRPGFGIGPAAGILFPQNVDQILFPGFNVMSVWHSNEWMIELRGRFFFGEVDVYHFEASGYRPLADQEPRVFAGGGIGYGGMNRKEMIIHTINGQPVPGVFYHNGNGMHAFMGVAFNYPQNRYGSLRFDIDYFIAFYNIGDIRMPSGLRLGMTMVLHAF